MELETIITDITKGRVLFRGKGIRNIVIWEAEG